MLSAGSRIDNYEVLELIGSGSQGLVYLCRHTRLDRMDAVKVLLARLSDNPQARARFEREAAHAARLQHLNIATIHDAGETGDGFLYVAMRYVEGPDLATLIRSNKMTDPKRALNVIEGLASALDAVHAAGLVHRDVKPSNVLLEHDPIIGEHAVLVDFGISKWWYEIRSGTNTAMGTYAYLAPERIVGHAGDDRSDQYSLGCTAFECLTGKPPFPSHSPAQIVKAHLESPPPKVSDGPSKLPTRVDAVLARALAKNPMDRYSSCGAFVSALRIALDRVPVSVATPAAASSASSGSSGSSGPSALSAGSLGVPRSVTSATSLTMSRGATMLAEEPTQLAEDATEVLGGRRSNRLPQLPSVPRELSTLSLYAFTVAAGAYGILIGSGGRAIGIAVAVDVVALVMARVSRRRAVHRNQRGRLIATVVTLFTVGFAALLYFPYRAYSVAAAAQVRGFGEMLTHFVHH